MAKKFWWVVFCLVLIVGCQQSTPVTTPSSAVDDIYIPGKRMSWGSYRQLLDNFSAASLPDFLAAIEPEALRAVIRVFTDANTTVHYISYTAEPWLNLDGNLFNYSMDGLLGLRVLRQLEVPFGDGSTRLISALTVHQYEYTSTHGPRFMPRFGPDTLRVRVELAPWHRFQEQVVGTMGFSWATYANANLEVGKIKAIPYVDKQGLARYHNVSTDGVANGCNSCHHEDHRNYLETEKKVRSYSQMAGYVEFMESLSRRSLPNEAQLNATEAALNHPEKYFPVNDIVQAMRFRLKEIEP